MRFTEKCQNASKFGYDGPAIYCLDLLFYATDACNRRILIRRNLIGPDEHFFHALLPGLDRSHWLL